MQDDRTDADQESSDEDDVTSDEEEEGFERCPLCAQLNNPGAADTCEHFAGSMWDGEIIWSEHYDEFSSAWSLVSNFLDDLGGSDDAVWERANEIAREHGLDSRLVGFANPYDYGSSDAMTDLIEFQEGAPVVTGGMLSGAGYSLYHRDPDIIQKYARRYRELAAVLRRTLAPDAPPQTA